MYIDICTHQHICIYIDIDIDIYIYIYIKKCKQMLCLSHSEGGALAKAARGYASRLRHGTACMYNIAVSELANICSANIYSRYVYMCVLHMYMCMISAHIYIYIYLLTIYMFSTHIYVLCTFMYSYIQHIYNHIYVCTIRKGFESLQARRPL